MLEGEMLRYGRVNPSSGDLKNIPVAMAASQAIKARSGRFVTITNGVASLAAAGTARLLGFLDAHEHTPAVGDVFGCDTDSEGIFRIPINSGTYVVGMVGDFTDISIASGIQGAALTLSVENTLIVMGGDATNNKWVDVKMALATIGTGQGV